ncbi:unnamed protein product [Rotaria sp. Silwood1]|nr:unnamed protein product [Rotaria sp. Silwood1]CAF1491553.1 unnamed protein product [Rotaria sp. Silwood1]CAF1513725.1 unnamed protein product [Rotaria sp. Silwood1]CAF3618297.1 unnamed protein product [Rotaria sp. Silwood1]CAF3626758.1 unnamed protein product [Rotaria sp. Silwood1]
MYILWTWPLLISTIFAFNHQNCSVHGKTDPGWEFLQHLFLENFHQEHDLGASFAVYYEGKPVVDLWGGWFNELKSKPYDHDTLQIPFSTTKGLVATAVALCVQRGLLNYSSPVRQYWPEYGQYGKENTTVADILSHRAGLSSDISPFELALNWTAIIHILEQRKPEWTPGTAHGYHGLTYGWLTGELVRRVDPKKRTFGQFIQDEITNPLKIEFYIGLPKEKEYRVSPLYFDSNVRNIIDERTLLELSVFNDYRYHQAEIPGVNGITNARSVARLYASLLGDLDNRQQKRLLNEDIMKKAAKSNTPENEIDLVRGFPNVFAMGFQVFDKDLKAFGSGIFGHEGAGGSIGFAAPEKKLAFAYIVNKYGVKKNRQEISPRTQDIIKHIAKIINKHPIY